MKLITCFFGISFILFTSCSKEIVYVVSQSHEKIDSKAEVFDNIASAKEAARKQKNAVTILLTEGTYYLQESLVFTEQDNRTTIKAYQNNKVIISGAVKLNGLNWIPYQNGIMQAKINDDISFDQLFVNGKLQYMARYPNYNASASHYNGTDKDAISPDRVGKWANPSGGYIHALHRHEWGGYHWEIQSKTEEGELSLNGGYQNNRLMGMHQTHRFVENVFEELDAPSEWFYDKTQKILYFYPPENIELSSATIEIPQLKELIIIKGSKENPVKNIVIEGIELAHTLRTFMDTKEPLLRSDWAIYRGGAVFMENAEHCTVNNCVFNTVGGNAIFFSNYNRHNKVSGCHIYNAGASGICFVGDPAAVRSALFEYNQHNNYAEIDPTTGPKTDNYPAQCLVHDNLIHNIGRTEKQIAGVQISMAQGITVSHNTIYNLPRAGINISEGTWGGHVIEYNDVFNTVLETGDHGSFNSWGRDRFWHPNRDSMDVWTERNPDLILLDAVETTYIRNNRFRCDHGWDIDLDDGSSNYHISNNVCLNGGLKLREGFYRTVENNIMINNSFHPHVWFTNSGDVFKHNIVMKNYFPIRVNHWGKEVDYNLFPDEAALEKAKTNGTDANSAFGSPEFVNADEGDYQVKESSKALSIGFKNFAMDKFGVTSPHLKSIAAKPIIPHLIIADNNNEQVEEYAGMKLKNITTLGDRSAAGLSETSGVWVMEVSEGSKLYGKLKSGDVIISFNNIKISTIEDLKKAEVNASKKATITYIRNQKEEIFTINF